MPRFMALVKATDRSEAGEMPSERELAEMGAFNEELVAAGVLLAGEGLHPSARGARVLFGGEQPEVAEGPFAETTQLVSGFWLLQAASLEEAVAWIRKAPFPNGQVEIREVFEIDDFGDAATPEIREQEARLRAQVRGV